jgi:hypothetical protein
MRVMPWIVLMTLLSFHSRPHPSAAAAMRPAPQLQVTAPAVQHTSKVWIGHYAEYEGFLRTAAIVRTAGNHVFFELGALAAGAGVHRGVIPNRVAIAHREYKAEIAGYKLDRLLRLDMVPPTVERRVDGEGVSIQLWIENARMLREVQAQGLHAPDPDAWDYQLQRAHLFEDLVANLDTNEGSPIIDSGWNLMVLDHSMGFTTTTEQPYTIGTALDHVDRPFFDRVKALDKPAVERALSDLLEPGALDALFARRDVVVNRLEKLATEKGADRVFPPRGEQ